MSDLPDTDQPDPATDGPVPDAPAPDAQDDGDALGRASAAIREAHDAEGAVAANDDITTRDDERAGEHSEDPGGEGGHP
jgi:hypothetical protein